MVCGRRCSAVKLKEISERTGVSKRNIHFYIKEGLLLPEVSQNNGYYSFSESDCERLATIRALREIGFPLVSVRAMLENPSTMGYYLTQHQRRLRQDIAHAERCVECIGGMMGKLPLRPKYADLIRLIFTTDIPWRSQADLDVDYDAALVNRILWTALLPEEKLTDYQEFLWEKLNKAAAERYSEEYRKVYTFLSQQSRATIDSIYVVRSRHNEKIVSFGTEEIEAYSKKMIELLSALVDSPRLIKLWIAQYDGYFQPLTRIAASELAGIVEEMSPFFQLYRKNINAVCMMTYEWLHSESGTALLTLMKKRLGTHFDLECDDHGQLEAMASFQVLG